MTIPRAIFSVRATSTAPNTGSVVQGEFLLGEFPEGSVLRHCRTGQRLAAPAGACHHVLELAAADDAAAVPLQFEAGDVITLWDDPLELTDHVEATLQWHSGAEGFAGRAYVAELARQRFVVTISSIKHRLGKADGHARPASHLEQGDTAVVSLAFSRPVAALGFDELASLGTIQLLGLADAAGGGQTATSDVLATAKVKFSLRRAQNIHRQALSIRREDRERLNGHGGCVVWMTGLSGSGKSTLANALEVQLHAEGCRTHILDGDNVRQGLNKDLGFTEADRIENIRRVAEVAKLMMDAGLVVITAFISPYRAERAMARSLIGERFIEVFVDTPLDVCEARDPKGLYKKARAGLLPNLTGVGSPYEPPEAAEVVVSRGYAIGYLTKLVLGSTRQNT